MSTVVIRSKNKHKKGILNLSDDAQRRAREYLKSAGYAVEKIQPLIWPEDAVSASRTHMYAPWQFTTKADVLRERRKRMEYHLWFKREYGVIQRRPLYVWVFWCPGFFGFAYRGWWLYLIGRGISSSKYLEKGKKTVARLMELFPLVEPNLFGPPDLEKWKSEFVKRYKRGRWCGKPQGKAPVWAEIKGDRIERILSRAEWPVK